MRTTLANRYEALAADERFALRVAADVRHDDQELLRLEDSAPRELISVAHDYELGMRLRQLELHHAIAMLNRSALLHRAYHLHEQRCSLRTKDDSRNQRFLEAIQSLAHRMLLEVEAWHRLEEHLNLAPNTLLHELPGYDEIQHGLDLARQLADDPATAPRETASIPGVERLEEGYLKLLYDPDELHL